MLPETGIIKDYLGKLLPLNLTKRHFLWIRKALHNALKDGKISCAKHLKSLIFPFLLTI